MFLLFVAAVSAGTLFAQSMQLPSDLLTGSGDGEYSALKDPVLPQVAPGNTAGKTERIGKLTMISSPNPFTTRTVITCTLPEKGKLTLSVRNMFGECVKTIESNVEQEGNQTFEVTSEQLRPGIYTVMLALKTSDNMLFKTIRLVCTK